MAQLIGKDVTLGYEGNVVIEHLNFSVQTGDYLYIVGENGSGKSTLMKAILGLKSPMAGTIATGDGLQPDEIGYLPQQTAVQRDFPASVLEIVRSGCLNHSGFRPFYTKQEKQNDSRRQLHGRNPVSLIGNAKRDCNKGKYRQCICHRAENTEHYAADLIADDTDHAEIT